MRRITTALALAASNSLTKATVAQTESMLSGTQLYQVDLTTGELMPIGTIGDGETVVGLALDTTAEMTGPAWAMTSDAHLIQFDVATPDMPTATMEITGLEDGDWLVGIDVRPATGELFGISASGVVYMIDTETGEAMAPGEAIDPALESDSIGFDFNPTVDRIRVDVATTQNLRLNPETGAVGTNPDTGNPTIDGNLAFAAEDASAVIVPEVVGAGYTNSIDGAEESQLFAIDAATNSLALQDPPNDGTLNTIGELSEMVNAYTSFDVAPDGTAYLSIPAWDETSATPENEKTLLLGTNTSTSGTHIPGQ